MQGMSNIKSAITLSIRPIVLIFSVLIICASAIQPIESMDFFWHLRLGYDWVFNGLFPAIDRYNPAYNGQTLNFIPFLFEGLIAMIHKTAGIYGLIFLRAAAWLFGLIALLSILKKRQY